MRVTYTGKRSERAIRKVRVLVFAENRVSLLTKFISSPFPIFSMNRAMKSKDRRAMQALRDNKTLQVSRSFAPNNNVKSDATTSASSCI